MSSDQSLGAPIVAASGNWAAWMAGPGEPVSRPGGPLLDALCPDGCVAYTDGVYVSMATPFQDRNPTRLETT